MLVPHFVLLDPIYHSVWVREITAGIMKACRYWLWRCDPILCTPHSYTLHPQLLVPFLFECSLSLMCWGLHSPMPLCESHRCQFTVQERRGLIFHIMHVTFLVCFTSFCGDSPLPEISACQRMAIYRTVAIVRKTYQGGVESLETWILDHIRLWVNWTVKHRDIGLKLKTKIHQLCILSSCSCWTLVLSSLFLEPGPWVWKSKELANSIHVSFLHGSNLERRRKKCPGMSI